MKENWWPEYRIKFSRPQMRWLISHIEEIKNGDWPAKPDDYIEPPRPACREAKVQGWHGYCIGCPFIPCLNPTERTPGRVRKERNINRRLEIAGEVEARLELVIDYISGWFRPGKRIKRRKYVKNSRVK